jgi:hypothetical protein
MTAYGWSRREFLIAAGRGTALLLLGGGLAPAPIPEMLDCDAWEARPPRSPIPTLARRPTRIIVHHTADPDGHDRSRAAAIRVARGVQDFHMDRRNWIDSGQQFTISRGGFVLEGRHRSLEALRSGRFHVVGAHCTGQNDIAVGIENEGTYDSVAPPRPQLDRLRELCAALCRHYRIPPAEIRGHREYRDTACPGNTFFGLLPQLRVDVGRIIGRPQARAESTRPVWPLLHEGDEGPRVLAAQYLLRAAGYDDVDVDVDGEFGPATDRAVRRFQADRHCEEVNGLIGGETWPLLTRDVPVGSGSGANAVRALRSTEAVLDRLGWQRLLGARG